MKWCSVPKLWELGVFLPMAFFTSLVAFWDTDALVWQDFGLLSLAVGSSCFDFQTPSFLEDTVILNQATAVSLFRGKIVSLLNSLSARRHCRFVSTISSKIGLSISTTQDMLNKMNKNSVEVKKIKRRTCRHWNSKINQIKKLFRISESTKQHSNKTQRMRIVYQELPKLYNNLPLPFQCEILLEVGRLSAMNGLDLSENSVHSVTKMNLYEVGNIIRKSEKVISSKVSMVRVANRCIKVLAGEKYRTTDVVVSVATGNQPLQKWKRNLRDKMPWICGKFALDNGIKVENLHNFTVKKNLPFSAYFTHILNATVVGSRYEVKFHMHLLQANSMALEARFVLAALNAVSKKDLETILQVTDIKYWAVDHYIGTAIQSVHSYNLKMLFPTYLRAFFNLALRRHERCLIIHLMSKYSNSSTEKISAFLRRKRVNVNFPCSVVNGVMSVILSPKRNRENEVKLPKVETSSRNTVAPTAVVEPFWHVHKVDKKEKSMQRKIVHLRKATLVEIVMFVLFGALAIVLIIFTFTCILFTVRKRRVRRQQKEIATNANEGSSNGGQNQTIVVDAGKLSEDELRVELDVLKWKAGRLSRPLFWSRTSSNLSDEQNIGDNLIGVPLEPLRLSTDDEESRCGEEEACVRLFPSQERSGLFFLGKETKVSINQPAVLCNGKKNDKSCSDSDVFASEIHLSEAPSDNRNGESFEEIVTTRKDEIDGDSNLREDKELLAVGSDQNTVKKKNPTKCIWVRRSKDILNTQDAQQSESSRPIVLKDSKKGEIETTTHSAHTRSLFYRKRMTSQEAESESTNSENISPLLRKSRKEDLCEVTYLSTDVSETPHVDKIASESPNGRESTPS